MTAPTFTVEDTGGYRQDPPDAAMKNTVHEAEQMLRYFMRRDEMNAEIHLTQPFDQPSQARVRYSPITYSARQVVHYLYDQLYVDPPRWDF